ncbi:hypothetical protein EON71_00280 [bacterium]|nr:MAG: hypothetical protein EON71_00280 [bacterium]
MRNSILEFLNKTPKEKKIITEMLNNVHNRSARLVPFVYKKNIETAENITHQDNLIILNKILKTKKIISKDDFQPKINKELIFENQNNTNKQVLKKQYDYNYFESLNDFEDKIIYDLINNRYGEKQFIKEMGSEYIKESKFKAVKFLIKFRTVCESGSTDEIPDLVQDLNTNHEELRSVMNDICIKMYQLACDQGYIDIQKINASTLFTKYLDINKIEKPENLIIHPSINKPSNDAFKTLNECISAMKLALANKHRGIFITCDIPQAQAIDYLNTLGLKPSINSNIGSSHQKNFDVAVINWEGGTYRFMDIKFTNLNQMSGRYNGPFVLHFGNFKDKSKVDSLREFIKNNALLDLNYYLEFLEGEERQAVVTELLNVINSDKGLQTDLTFSYNDKAYMLYESIE